MRDGINQSGTPAVSPNFGGQTNFSSEAAMSATKALLIQQRMKNDPRRVESNPANQVDFNIGDEEEIDITSPASIKLTDQRKARELWRKAKLNPGVKVEDDNKAAKGSSWSFFREVYEKKEINGKVAEKQSSRPGYRDPMGDYFFGLTPEEIRKKKKLQKEANKQLHQKYGSHTKAISSVEVKNNKFIPTKDEITAGVKVGKKDDIEAVKAALSTGKMSNIDSSDNKFATNTGSDSKLSNRGNVTTSPSNESPISPSVKQESSIKKVSSIQSVPNVNNNKYSTKFNMNEKNTEFRHELSTVSIEDDIVEQTNETSDLELQSILTAHIARNNELRTMLSLPKRSDLQARNQLFTTYHRDNLIEVCSDLQLENEKLGGLTATIRPQALNPNETININDLLEDPVSPLGNIYRRAKAGTFTTIKLPEKRTEYYPKLKRNNKGPTSQVANDTNESSIPASSESIFSKIIPESNTSVDPIAVTKSGQLFKPSAKNNIFNFGVKKRISIVTMFNAMLKGNQPSALSSLSSQDRKVDSASVVSSIGWNQ